jgi:hypothetical protein
VRQRLSLRSPARKRRDQDGGDAHGQHHGVEFGCLQGAGQLGDQYTDPVNRHEHLPDNHTDEAQAGADTKGGDQLRHDRGQHEHSDRGRPPRPHAPGRLQQLHVDTGRCRHDSEDYRKHTVRDAEGDLGRPARPEGHNEQRIKGYLRQCLQQVRRIAHDWCGVPGQAERNADRDADHCCDDEGDQNSWAAVSSPCKQALDAGYGTPVVTIFDGAEK